MSPFVRTCLVALAALSFGAALDGCKKAPVVPPAAKMQVSPAAKLAWGEVPLKGSVTRTVNLTNLGTVQFVVTDATVTPADGPFKALLSQRDVPTGQSLEIPVTFLATATGEQTATLTIKTNNAEIPVATIALSATGVEELFCAPCTQPARDSCLSGQDLLLNERVGTCPDGQCQFDRRVLECAAGCDFLTLSCFDVPCPAGAPASITSGNADAQGVALASTRAGYGMVLSVPKDGKKTLAFSLYGADRKQRSGDPMVLSQVHGEGWSPALAWTGDGFGLAYVGNKDGDEEIYATTLGSHGDAPRDPMRITSAPGTASSPAIAAGDGARAELGVAWVDGRATAPGVYFVRVSAVDGTKIGDEVEVAQLPAEAHATSPAVAWNGSSWLVAWSDDRDGDGSEIYAARVSNAGAAVGGPVRVSSGAGESVEPQLTTDGSLFFAAWSDARSGKFSLYTRVLKDDGTQGGQEEELTVSSGNVRSPRMSLGAKLQAFAWIDDRLDGGGPGLYAAVRSQAHPALDPVRVSRVNGIASPALVPTFGQFGLAFIGVQEPREKADVFLQTVCAPADAPPAGGGDAPDAGTPGDGADGGTNP